MQVFFQIMNVDFIAFVTIVYLILFMRGNSAYDRSLHRPFASALVLLACLAVSDNVDYYCSWASRPLFARKLAIMAGYIFRVFLLMSAVFILKRRGTTPREKAALFAPAVLNALIILSALFTDRVFYLDQSNNLHRLPLSFAPHVLSMIYFFVVLGVAVSRYARGMKEEGRMLFVSLLAVIMGVVAEIVLKTRGIFMSAVSIMLTFYYLYLHMEHYKRDTLTGVLNRMSFFACMNKFRGADITALCEFDMNNLKWINDTLGHSAGDCAIVTVASTIQNALPPKSQLFRMGGDEFLALFCGTDMQAVRFTLEKIRADLAQTDYSCAVGMVEWDAGKDFRELYNLADRLMYEDKQRLRALGVARFR